MNSIAFKTTGFMLDILTKLIKADIRMHNADVVRDDMSIVFVVNHFTRVETVLLPYVIHRHTGLGAWSLASGNLFFGRLGGYLHSVGTISTRDPDRDKIIISSLLSGEHPWIIFPEGGMIKDKKLIDHVGDFKVYSKGVRRPPHTGAAVLALRAEYYRQKLRCLDENPHLGGKQAVLDRFGLDSFEQAARFHTVIVPVNITYFPIRSGPNLIMRIARRLAKDLNERAIEELSVEGTVLSQESDIDIRLGEPIDVKQFMTGPEFARLLACGDDDLEKLEADPRSVFNKAARRLMRRYMADIYGLTTINYDHIFATLIRHQRSKSFTERAYRNRIFLSAREIVRQKDHPVHDLLTENYQDILYEDPSPKFDAFVKVCLEEGILSKEDSRFIKNFMLKRGRTGFHSVRREELTYVIANEIEPLKSITELIRGYAQAPRKTISRLIRELFIEEDQRIFEEDYKASFNKKISKSAEIGRPFLLRPARIKAGIVLVHGYLAAPLEVRAMAEYFLDRGYAVYGVRLKGHGTSPDDLAATPWEAWYESVNRGYAVIKSLTDRIVLGGFSTGGGLALLAAGRKGDKIQAAFSINAPLQLNQYAANLVPPVMAVNTLLARLKRRRKEWEFIENDTENAHINYDQNPLAGVRQLGEAMEAMERTLGSIRAPTLIIQGSRDPVVDPDSGGIIFTQVGTPHKQLIFLERDRHGIINEDGADDVFDHVDQFLQWAEKKNKRMDVEREPTSP